LWVNVIKCHNVFIAINYLGRNIAGDDFAEQAV